MAFKMSGFNPGVGTGMGSAMKKTSAYKKPDETILPEEQQSKTTAEKKDTKKLTFNEAFAAAEKAGKKTFMWEGKSYAVAHPDPGMIEKEKDDDVEKKKKVIKSKEKKDPPPPPKYPSADTGASSTTGGSAKGEAKGKADVEKIGLIGKIMALGTFPKATLLTYGVSKLTSMLKNLQK